MISRYDLIVIGGGVIGGGVAERMSAGGMRVCLVDMRTELGLGASSAAIGGINPHLGDHCLTDLGIMAERSQRLYPDWIEHLCDRADVTLPLVRTGLLQVAVSDAELQRLVTDVLPTLLHRGTGAEVLDRKAALACEPLLDARIRGAVHLPGDLAVEPVLLMRTLRALLMRDRRIDVLLSSVVTSVRSSPFEARVTLADGRRMVAEQVVVAGGHFSNTLLNLRTEALYPVKGQAVEFPAVPGRRLSVTCDAVVPAPDGSEVAFALPRPDGRIAAGVTFEEHVQDTETTRAARESILHCLGRVFTGADRWPVSRHWAGVRPGSDDGNPVLGFVDDEHRVLAATGHYGLGVTLAPITVALAAKLLLDGRLTREDRDDLKLCDPARFQRSGFTERRTGWPSPTAH